MSARRGYILDIPDGVPRQMAVGWLLLALGSLVLGGLMTVLIVLSRTPGIQDFMPWIDFFHTAIVVHVDLTVLVWFLAFAGVFWSLSTPHRAEAWGWSALSLAVIGTLRFAVSPFFGAGDPLMNNYVPVLDDREFLFSLALAGVGFTALMMRGAIFSWPRGALDSDGGVLRVGLYTAILAGLVAVLALAWTCWKLPSWLSGNLYYEYLFWGSGHVLQFTHTQLMLVGWLWMATVSGLTLPLPRRLVFALLIVGFLPVIATPAIYMLHDPHTAENRQAFIEMMRWGGGLATLPLGLAILAAFVRQRPAGITPEKTALVSSILLFGVGGVIGFLIHGANVTIPAHYHGSIVAVTLIFMGVTYHLLPRLGFEQPSRLARWQPILYGGGQLLHVLGLAWSGGYGVARKTAGAAQGLESVEAIAGMAVMGLGGLISVIGGVLFLVIAIRAMWPMAVRKSVSAYG